MKFSKSIKKWFSNIIFKIVKNERGELLANEEYTMRYTHGVELLCDDEHADYLMKAIREVQHIMNPYDLYFADHIKTVYTYPENFHSACIVSAICIKDLDLDRVMNASEAEHDRFIVNLVYRTLIAKEIQLNERFTGLRVFNKYSKDRANFLRKQAEEMVYTLPSSELELEWKKSA